MKTSLTLMAAGALLAAAPALAHAATAHPDFTGIWMAAPYSATLKPADGKPVPLKPEAKAVYDKHLAAAAKGDFSWDTARECLPEGLPRIMTIKKPFEILQRDKTVFFIAQSRVPWKAFFGEELPTDVDPMYMGYSTAKWDGAALVIESAGFRDLTVLDDKGLPHSEQLKLRQTYRLGKGGKTMTVTYRIDDPTDYVRPWTATATFVKKPASFQMPEEVCADLLKNGAAKK